MVSDPESVLIIDDDEDILFGLKVAMKRDGYQVFTATGGEEGLTLAQKHQPDIIVCDVMMPSPSGFELQSILSQNPDTADIPLIFLTAIADPNNKLYGIEAGADDYITKPFNRQELLARVKAVLRRVKVSRQQGLNEARAQLSNLHKAITSIYSHELRTPVSTILLALEIALDEKYNQDIEGQKQFIQTALDHAQRLSNLIEDLIALSILDRGEPDLFRKTINLPLDFQDPINKCLNLWSERHLDAHVFVDSNVRINAPSTWFKLAVTHLVDNACRFSPEGGRVDIHLAANGEGGCIFTVADDGPGVPAEMREKVFERYYQISSGISRLYDGLGVGLTITRFFARSLGGDVVFLDDDRRCKVRMTIPPDTGD